MFLSEKPILYVLNIGESTQLGKDLEAAVGKYNLTEIAARPNAGPAHLRQSRSRTRRDDRRRRREFLGSYGLTDSGLSRLIRKSYHLLG